MKIRRLATVSMLAVTAAGCAVPLTSVAAKTPPAPASAQVPASASSRPNVLFIMIDDLRPDLGIYGHPTSQTPNMDALGRSGLVFDNAFVSQAVCGPSRAALMTGLRPDTTGVTTLETPIDQVAPNAVTMLDTFKRAGYQTLGFGKIYHHTDDDADGWTLRVPDKELESRKADRAAKIPRRAVGMAEDGKTLPDTMNVEAALKELPKAAKSGKPFFMAVGIHRPHLPFISPKANWAHFTPAKVPGPINPEGQKDAPPWALVSYEVWGYPDTKGFEPNMPKDKADELRMGYLAAVNYADDLVGDLLGALKKQGLDDNTIVVLWGDHGWKLGDHKAWAKHSTAEIDIHIPLIVRAPGATKAGTRTKALVESVDLYPTLAELAGLKTPDNLEGKSLTPLMADPGRQWKQAAFAQYPRNGAKGMGRLMGYTVRTATYRYTGWVDKNGALAAQEFYDLVNDPIEAVNVAGVKSYAKAVAEAEALRRGGPGKVRAAIK